MRSLTFKVALACLAASLLGIGLVAVFAVFTTSRAFGSYVFDERRATFETYLQTYYAEHGSWTGVTLFPMPASPPAEATFGRGGLTLVDAAGRVVVAGAGHTVGQQLTAAEIASGQTIKVKGVVVGTLVPVPNAPGFTGPAGNAFLDRINQALILGVVSATVVALLIGWLLARALTQPLKALTRASQAISLGELGQQVPVRSGDEIGQLATAFNRMSADLGRVSRLRRQMTADVAHELRTPISLILAHTEALRDGVLPPSAETYALLNDEALRLNRLVEDLRILSLADAGELSITRRAVSPEVLLHRAVAAHVVRAQQQQIDLQLEAAPDLPNINADPDRLNQVLGNLVDNALRYTPSSGRICCDIQPDHSGPTAGVVFSIADTGPGITAEDLPNVFERFYRADKSRQRDSTSSGLGLAIARSIVEAHGGRIWVESQAGLGAKFFVFLPAMAAGDAIHTGVLH